MYRRNWLNGFARAVGSRIRKAEQTAAADAGALVLYKSDRERAEMAMHADFPDLVYVKSRRRYDDAGYLHGQLDGEAAQLHRSVVS